MRSIEYDAGYEALVDDRPTLADVADHDEPACPADEHGPDVDGCEHCPECGEGIVVPVGMPERDTGFQPYVCTRGCGFAG